MPVSDTETIRSAMASLGATRPRPVTLLAVGCWFAALTGAVLTGRILAAFLLLAPAVLGAVWHATKHIEAAP